MTRDGFTLLAMRFDGAKALGWKLLYIEAFNKMETELRAASPGLTLDDPYALRSALLTYTEKVIALQERIATLTPKAEALDRLSGMSGNACLRDVVTELGFSPQQLGFETLRRMRWIYRREGGGWRGYQEKLADGCLEHVETPLRAREGKTAIQCVVTPKGRARLAELLEKRRTSGGEVG